MAVAGVAGVVAVEGGKRRGDYGHGHKTKERVGAKVGRNRGIRDVGWMGLVRPVQSWLLFNYHILLVEVSPGRTDEEGEEAYAGEIGVDWDRLYLAEVKLTARTV